MSRSLLHTLLKNGHVKSIECIDFWIGEVLTAVVPSLDLDVHTSFTTSYFQSLADIVVEGKLAYLITPTSWEGVTNKMVYNHHLESLPVPKIELDCGMAFSKVWKRLILALHSIEDRDTLFLGT